jgi:hypothetical protein
MLRRISEVSLKAKMKRLKEDVVLNMRWYGHVIKRMKESHFGVADKMVYYPVSGTIHHTKKAYSLHKITLSSVGEQGHNLGLNIRELWSRFARQKGVARKERKDVGKTKNFMRVRKDNVEDTILVLRFVPRCYARDDDAETKVSSVKGTRPLGLWGMSPLPENHEMPFHERWGEDFTEF